MSFAQHERGQFIKSRMMQSIIMAGGKGEIDAEEFGRIYDLISEVEISGSTHNSELVREPFYLQAVKDWQKVRERRMKKHEDRTIISQSRG